MKNAKDSLEKVRCLLNHYLVIGAHIGQGDYKKYLFGLCNEIFNSGYHKIDSDPRLTGDAIRDCWHDWYSADAASSEYSEEELAQVIDLFVPMWNEWLYAMEHYRP